MLGPLFAGNGYRYTPLQPSGESPLAGFEWCKENYDVNAFPTSFLIDHEGRQVAKPQVASWLDADRLATFVHELIAAAA